MFILITGRSSQSELSHWKSSPLYSMLVCIWLVSRPNQNNVTNLNELFLQNFLCFAATLNGRWIPHTTQFTSINSDSLRSLTLIAVFPQLCTQHRNNIVTSRLECLISSIIVMFLSLVQLWQHNAEYLAVIIIFYNNAHPSTSLLAISIRNWLGVSYNVKSNITWCLTVFIKLIAIIIYVKWRFFILKNAFCILDKIRLIIVK